MSSKMSGHLYHEVDCQNFLCPNLLPPTHLFSSIFALKVNSGVVCLTGSTKNQTVAPNGGMVL